MRVFTEDIINLFYAAIEKYKQLTQSEFGSPNNGEFFKSFTQLINSRTKNRLSSDTLYKQYYIRLQTYSQLEIGYSLNYLNALSQFVHDSDYTLKYRMVEELNDEIPEFPYPPYVPCFPATPSIRLKIDGFSDVWVKDESFNPTGIHKDRMAWEIYLNYNKVIKEQLDSRKRINIPRLSIISSGNAAFSIQYLLKLYGLPNLKVIIDANSDVSIIENLKKLGCEVYPDDLTTHKRTEEQIKTFTQNEFGIDITYGNEIAEIKLTYYDWLAYEVLNLNPHNVFIPVGSGDLYRNILEICHTELKSKHVSKRFFGNKEILGNCNFWGASTKDPNSILKMLYEPFGIEKGDIEDLYSNFGSKSNIYYDVKDKFVNQALQVFENNNIESEASGAAGLALFLQRSSELDPKEKHVIVNTGKLKISVE